MAEVEALHDTILRWYDENARELPWRVPADEWPWPEVDRPWGRCSSRR
jgi:A/G-specific DNA glycosylase